jgi:hypothetical protein
VITRAGPLEVFDRNDERRVASRAEDHSRHHVEQPEARLTRFVLRVAGGRVALGELGKKRRDLGFRLEELGSLVVDRAKDLNPRPERRGRVVVPARRPGGDRAAHGGVVGDVTEKRCLPDTRLAEHQRNSAVTVQRVVERGAQVAPFALTPDHGGIVGTNGNASGA